MSVIYTAISAVLLFWHAAFEAVLGDRHSLGTDWSWVLGIVFLVLTVRVLLLPLFVRQWRSQQALQRLTPKLKELQAKHKGDPQTLQRELTEFYRAEKVNPFGTFLPMLLQIPIFIGLLHVLRHLRPEITNPAAQTLYGWTSTQFTEATEATLFGAPIAAHFGGGGATVMLVAGALIAVMVVTTYLTSRMSILKTGWSQDPTQRTVQRLMLYGIPASLLISGAVFPIGVVLYWTTQNLFALGQQAWFLRSAPMDTTTAQRPISASSERRSGVN